MNRRGTVLRSAALATALAASVAVTVPAAPAVAATPSHPSCRGAQLGLSYLSLSGGSEHAGIALQFHNRGRHTCTLYGYPGFDAVNAHGTVLRHATRTFVGYLGGSRKHTLERVAVRPGHYASATVEWENIDRHGNDCRFAAGFDFTPAGTKRTVHRDDRSVSVCHLQVHPTVPGRSGRSG